VKREIHSTRISIAENGNYHGENVVERLRRRIGDLRTSGMVVRTDWLDDQQASWCELRGVRTIILDAAQPAADQLSQLEEILQEISQIATSASTRPISSPSASRAA
jgi:hypothetical protein